MNTYVIKISSIFIFLVLLIVGCAAQEPIYVTKYEYKEKKVCYHRSDYFGAEFVYPCEEREKARTAGVICDVIAASAYSQITWLTTKKVTSIIPPHN